MVKNGPGVALNRPQDTERYNAKDSIVSRAVKCSCLVSKTKWATLGVLRPFILAVLPVLAHHLITSSTPRQFEEGSGRRSSVELRKLRDAFFSRAKRGNGVINANTLSSINNNY